MVCAPVRRDNPQALAIIDRTGAQTMLYLTCTMISSVNLAHYGVSHAKIGYLWIVVQYKLYHSCQISKYRKV